LARLGHCYRAGIFAAVAYYTATGSGALEGALFIVAFTGLVWLIGRAILYVLAGR
jgi:hypothetical protein